MSFASSIKSSSDIEPDLIIFTATSVLPFQTPRQTLYKKRNWILQCEVMWYISLKTNNRQFLLWRGGWLYKSKVWRFHVVTMILFQRFTNAVLITLKHILDYHKYKQNEYTVNIYWCVFTLKTYPKLSCSNFFANANFRTLNFPLVLKKLVEKNKNKFLILINCIMWGP